MQPRWLSVVSLVVVLVACNSVTGEGPSPFRPEFYSLTSIDDSPLPQLYIKDFPYSIVGGTLVPYAVGHTIDQRLVNDRGGRGATGGNTRDTTVLRGQFMDIRTLQTTLFNGELLRLSDSMIVDVELVDTTMIITRPHPDPARTRVDTGYFVNNQLVLSTSIDTDRYAVYTRPFPRRLFKYQVTR